MNLMNYINMNDVSININHNDRSINMDGGSINIQNLLYDYHN